MRRPSLPALLAVVAVLLAACGGGGSKSAVSGRSPQEMVRTASEHLGDQSFRFDVDGGFTFDTSRLTGVSNDQLKQFAGQMKNLKLTAAGEAETARRVRLDVSFKPLADRAVVVLYDGDAYYSADGTRFAKAGSTSDVTGGVGVTPGELQQYLAKLGSRVKDLGSTSMDGLGVEHLQATIDQSFLSTLMQSAQGATGSATPNPLGGMFTSLIGQMVHIDRGNVDAYVDQASGRLDRVAVDLAMTFDLGKLAALFGGFAQGQVAPTSMPGGSFSFAIKLGTHFHDYGASIHVSRPAVDPTAPTPASGNGLFGNLGM